MYWSFPFGQCPLPVVFVAGVGELGLRVDAELGVVDGEQLLPVVDEELERLLGDGSVGEREAAGHLFKTAKFFNLKPF